MTQSPLTKEFSKLVKTDIFDNAKGHAPGYVYPDECTVERFVNENVG